MAGIVLAMTPLPGSATPLDKAAAISSVITSEDIEAMGARDLEEVLQTIPGMHVGKNPIVYVPNVRVRGVSSFYGAQTLYMINGVPIQSLYVGHPSLVWAGMPLKAVERIEVIRGPGSALYGADAFSGAINIITKSAADIPKTQVGVTGGSFDTYGSWVNTAYRAGGIEGALSLEYNQTRGFKETIDSDTQTLLDAGGTTASLAPGEVNTGHKQIEMRTELGAELWTWRVGYQGRNDAETGAGVYEVTEQKNFGTTILPDNTVLPLFPRPNGLEDVTDSAETFLPEKDRSSGHFFIQDEWQLR
jgi:outer membrane cobalamin receptor